MSAPGAATLAPDPGRGVFETLLVRAGRVQALDAHLTRLAASLERLFGAALPADAGDRVRARAAPLRGAHRLRLDATLVDAAVVLEIVTSALDGARPRPVALAPVTVAGGLGAHKWRDRAMLDALGPGALLVDADGLVLEGAWANAWLLLDAGRSLATAPDDGRILPGVTRARLLALAPSLGLAARERPIALEEARTADAVVLTSSLRLAVIGVLDGRAPGPAAAAAVERIRVALGAGDWSA